MITYQNHTNMARQDKNSVEGKLKISKLLSSKIECLSPSSPAPFFTYDSQLFISDLLVLQK